MCLGKLSIGGLISDLPPLKKMTENDALTQDSLNHGQNMCIGVCIECK